MSRIYPRMALLLSLAVLALSACGPGATETPVDPGAAYTAAAQTVIAQFTELAATGQPAPLPSITPTATLTPFASATLGTSTPTLTRQAPQTTASNCNSIYISDVTIPDGTVTMAGQEFLKTWRIQNTGTCTWTTSFVLVYSYGEQMSGQAVALTAPVESGRQVDVSVRFRAPTTAGDYTSAWVMSDGAGRRFGTALTVIIKTALMTPTATGGTPTATPTSTSTQPQPSATATMPQPTATQPLPSATATQPEVPTATNTTGP